MTEIIIIAAVAKNGVIGKDGKLPWNIKEDLEHFKELTLNHTIIMGRKTFESLPIKPLPKRKTIVVTRNNIEGYDGKLVVKKTINEAIEYAKNRGDEKIFLIGGQSIYREGLDYADKIELTHIKKDYEGDTFFPTIDKTKWKLVKTEDKKEYSFDSYIRIEN